MLSTSPQQYRHGAISVILGNIFIPFSFFFFFFSTNVETYWEVKSIYKYYKFVPAVNIGKIKDIWLAHSTLLGTTDLGEDLKISLEGLRWV